MQRPGPSFIEGNLLQLRERKEEPSGERRAQWKSGLHKGVSKLFASGNSVEQVQKGNDRLVLAISLAIGVVPSSLTNEIMPCRHRGQAIEPGGPRPTAGPAFVEHRYRAQ